MNIKNFKRHLLNPSRLRKESNTIHPAELAAIVRELPADELPKVYRSLESKKAVRLFEHLDFPSQRQILEDLTPAEVGFLLNNMAPDDRTALLTELPSLDVSAYLDLLGPKEKDKAFQLLGYPEDSVGRLMTPTFVSIRPEMTVAEAIRKIRHYGNDSEVINVVFITDKDGKLLDDMPLRRLLLHDESEKIEKLMDHYFVKLNAHDSQEEAVKIFKEYDRIVLPVVNSQGRLMGVVTIDDVFDVAEAEDTEDIQKFGGLESLEYTYRDTPLLRLVRKRALWLMVLFIGELLTATAMSYFDEELSKAVVLAFFVPLIISSGGNSGSQAATLIIRALALQEFRLRNWWYVMRRELISGLLLGLILGAIGFGRIFFGTYFTDIYGEYWYLIALTVGLSLLFVVMWGTLTGSMLPFLLQRLGLDPATSSAPFVATLVDVTGLVIYFSIAIALLQGYIL